VSVVTLVPDPRTPASAAPVRRPLLLLPPALEPPPSEAEVALATLTTLAVTSTPTDRPWPLPDGPPAPELPDPDRLCGAVALAALEAIAGVRPVGQLARWVSPAVLEAVVASLAPARRQPASARSVPARRATVRRTLVLRLSSTVAEGSVVLHDGTRFRAAALRLEVHRDRWRVTVLQIG